MTRAIEAIVPIVAIVAIVAPTIAAGGAASSPRLALARLGAGAAEADEREAPLGFGVFGLPQDALAALADPALPIETLRAIWSVHVERAENPALLGRYRVSDGALWLVPSFPPQPGVRYHAVLRPGMLAARFGFESALSAELALDASSAAASLGAPARVASVHPETDEVPENLLRLYVHFTGPMSRGHALRFVRLEDEGGGAIDGAFLDLDGAFLDLEEELWDRDSARLTLLLDPGRIKQGLVPRREEGPALRSGSRVTLVIDAGWPDAAGRPLAESWRRALRVVPADRVAIDPARWRLAAPRAGARAPLHVAFDEPLDHALLHRWVWVEDAAGGTVAGSIAVGAQGREWRFAPTAPWAEGVHVLRVDRRLEDLAGNRVGQPFEIDLAAAAGAGEPEHDPVRLPFSVAP